MEDTKKQRVTRIYSYKMGYVRALSVIAVVLAHSGMGGLNMLPGLSYLFVWFSPFSFMIPAFFFVSGYFFDESPKIISYIKKRFKRLVIPYYSWNLFYAFVFSAVVSLGLVQWVYSVNLVSFFVQPWITGNQYLFNLAAWFVLSLFLIQVAFMLLRKIFNKLKLTNEYLLFVLFLALGLAGTYLVSLGYTGSFYLILDRTLFGLPFVQLGFLYKAKLEKFDKPRIINIITLIIIQFSLLQIYGNLDFDTLSLTFHGKILQPFLSSFTGIWFCLQVSMILTKFLSPSTLPSKLLKHIGDNSWSIMVNQFLGFWLLSTAFLLLGANGFNLTAYRTDIYYKYLINGDAHFVILYLLIGISFPLLFTYCLTKLRGQLLVPFKKRNKSIKISVDHI